MQFFILEANTIIGHANIIINDRDNLMEAGGFYSCHVDIKHKLIGSRMST